MSEENNNNLNDFIIKYNLNLSKEEYPNLKPILTYNYTSSNNDMKIRNMNKTTNNIYNHSNLNPSFKNNNNTSNISHKKSKSLSNNMIISPNNSYNYKINNNSKSKSKNKTDDQYQEYINNNINTEEAQIKSLLKEISDLKNEIKKEKQQRNQDKKNIELLKHTINNLISENNKNIINYSNTSPSSDKSNNKKNYADLLLLIETIKEENNTLKQTINEYTNNESEIEKTKKRLNDYKVRNEELNNKCEILEKQTTRLNDNLKDFKKFEEIKILKESLEKKFNIIEQENIELKKYIKDKDDQINDLKLMKYDDKLLFFEQKLNEYKLKDENNQIYINKLNNEIDDTKKKLYMTSQLLEEGQNTIKENRTNIEDNTIRYNNLKNNYDTLNSMKEKIILENNELKLKNTQINNELIQFKDNYIKYKDEAKNINMQLMILKNEKSKNEIYFLNQISLLQKEKNYIEKELNKIREKYNNNIKNDANNIEEDNNDKYNKKKYDLALQEIKTYNRDNKKLYDLCKKLKNDINYEIEAKDFYSKIINKILEGNYIDMKYNNFVQIIKKCIENFLDIQHLNKLKYELNSKLKNYEHILNNMNKKPDSTGTGKSYEINKNFYDVDDFSEIAKIQNQIVIINDKLNGLDENKNKIMNEFEKY